VTGWFGSLALLLLLTGIGLPQRALADQCGGTTTQRDLDECYGRAYRQADAELNTAYRRLAGKIGGSDRAKDLGDMLEAAERAWVEFRDRECDFETADTRGGSIHSMEVTICRTGQTEVRIKELRRQLTCPEGDLSCVR
jgi:uncharacterized protein YecT (DUF1311 family)